MKSRTIVKFCLTAMIFASCLTANAQNYDHTTIDLAMPYPGRGFQLEQPGKSYTFQLPRRLFVHKLMLQVDSANGNSGAEIVVNGDRKGNTWLSSDPQWVVTVEAETSSIQINAINALRSPQGAFVVRSVKAVVSGTDWTSVPSVPVEVPLRPVCNQCDQLTFPVYYPSVMANVSNRAIILVDRLQEHANYAEYGRYLLPVKKAAAQAREVAKARGDASAYAKPYYAELLKSLDEVECYFADTFERRAAFELGAQLMGLREHIRDILD